MKKKIWHLTLNNIIINDCGLFLFLKFGYYSNHQCGTSKHSSWRGFLGIDGIWWLSFDPEKGDKNKKKNNVKGLSTFIYMSSRKKENLS